jgi:hypothetical protein
VYLQQREDCRALFHSLHSLHCLYLKPMESAYPRDSGVVLTGVQY